MLPITQYAFPVNQYVQTETTKTQIYLHHTAGNPNPIATFEWWASTPERVATCVAIGGLADSSGKWHDGEVLQGFSSKYWAYHLGLKESTFDFYNLPYKSLDKNSIAVEVCNWGQLTLGADGNFRNYVNRIVPMDQVCKLDEPYKGYQYYHAYTDAQIANLKTLLLLWKGKYNIPLTYHDDIWGISERALRGEAGVYTHNSVRKDKNDISPQPKMIEMLKSLA